MIKLSQGNSKTGKGLHIFNIPAVSTCIGSTEECRRKCYAMKAQRMYKQCREQREHNFSESVKDTFVDDVTSAIKENLFITYFRIHESGDFYSQEYLNKWKEIARKNPKVKFLAFTKSFTLDFSNLPKNLKIIMSVFPDTDLSKVPQGRRAYAGMKTKKAMFVCSGKCSSCLECWKGSKKDIYFEMH